MENDQHIQLRLEALFHEPETMGRTLSVLALLTKVLMMDGIQPVLVGGKAVELYTRGQHTSFDIDLVLRGRERTDAKLKQMGFEKNRGERHWYHEALDLAIEIPDDTLFGDMQKLTEIDTSDGSVWVIGVEDIILDRLRACKHWRSTRDCEQAEAILTIHRSDIDLAYVQKQAIADNTDDALAEILDRFTS